MSETGPSEWAPPAESAPKSREEMLNERYGDRSHPDDLDDMVVLPGEMITVPDWTAEIPTVNENSAVVETIEISSENDPFSKGKEIIVMRSANKETGAPAYADSGWKIFDDEAMKETKPGSGKFLAAVRAEKEIDGVMREKIITLDKVYELNRQETVATPEVAEEPQLTETQEDLAGEALEDAIGLHDPSEIDENAQMLNVKQLRAAAEHVNGVPKAELPSLDKAIEDTNNALLEMLQPHSVTDRAAVWQYATAINYAERDAAEKKLSHGFKDKNPGILENYKANFQKLHDLRVKAGILDK